MIGSLFSKGCWRIIPTKKMPEFSSNSIWMRVEYYFSIEWVPIRFWHHMFYSGFLPPQHLFNCITGILGFLSLPFNKFLFHLVSFEANFRPRKCSLAHPCSFKGIARLKPHRENISIFFELRRWRSFFPFWVWPRMTQDTLFYFRVIHFLAHCKKYLTEVVWAGSILSGCWAFFFFYPQ